MKSIEFNEAFQITGAFINYKVEAILDALEDHGFSLVKTTQPTSFSTIIKVQVTLENCEKVYNIFKEALKK